MNAPSHGAAQAGPPGLTHGDANGRAHGTTAEHAGSLREYVTGFVLAVTLTAIPFWLVMAHTFGRSRTTAAVILGLAAVQIVIHMVYFLHMNTRSEGGWTLLALLFTLMLVVIALSGSLWVMYHLNDNMMPGMSDGETVHDMSTMQATPGTHYAPSPQDHPNAHDMHHMHDMHDMPKMP